MTSDAPWPAGLIGAFALLLPAAGAAQGTPPPPPAVEPAPPEPGVTSSWDGARWISPRDPWTLTLGRPPAAGEGRIAVFVGHTDVTGLTTLAGGGEWRELARLPIRLLTPAGFERAAVVPRADLLSDGQIAEGSSSAGGAEDRGLYQDVTANLGFDGALAREGWALTSGASAVGVSRDELRLRFGERGLDAPAVDLSDYLVEVGRGPASLALGHTSFGANRHLVNGFASRGLTAGVKLAPAAQLGFAALNGSAPVGWSNPFGLSSADHRIWSAALGLELLPSRPGAVHLDATWSIVLYAGQPTVRADWHGTGTSYSLVDYIRIEPAPDGISAVVDGTPLPVAGRC